MSELELTNYTLTFDGTDPTHQFNIVFPSNITTPFVIKYRTTIDVEDYDKSSFTNTGTIGTGRSYAATVNKSIANTFAGLISILIPMVKPLTTQQRPMIGE